MKSKGFTLIELAVVLAIIAVLAAVLTPMVTGYLDQARTARAQADVRTIADAIKLYNRDTGRWPIYETSAAFSSNTTPANDIGTAGGTAPATGTGWTVAVGNTSLEVYLNNDKSGVGTAGFPKAGFRGPYIGTVDSDPWGHQYVLNASDLKGTTYHAMVASAGPNGALDVARDTAIGANVSTSGIDDIIAIIK